MRWKSIYSIDLDLRFCQSPIEFGLKIENLSINHNLFYSQFTFNSEAILLKPPLRSNSMSLTRYFTS